MTDIVVQAQRDVVLDFGPVTRIGQDRTRQPINLALNGTKLWFTVKRNVTDDYASAVVAKSWEYGVSSDGFSLSTYSSLTLPNGAITIGDDEVTLEPSRLFAFWYWDLTLEEPDGRRETVDGGTFKVTRPISDPA